MASIFMPQTPIIVFAALLAVLACYIIYSGLEVLTRVNGIILFIIIPAITFILSLVAKDIELNKFLPTLESGIKPVILGSIAPASWLSECTIILMLIPFISNAKQAKKANILAVTITSIIMLLVIICSIGVMGASSTGRMLFPTFSLLTEISLPAATIFERVRIIFMIAWVAGMLTKFSTFFYAGILGMAQWLNLKEYRTIIFPIGVILVTLSILSWNNVIELADFSEKTFPLSVISVNLFLTFFLYVVSILKK